MPRAHETSSVNTRLVGFLYLAIIVCGIGSEAVLRGPLIDIADADATVKAIRGAAGAFRLSLAADLVMAVCDVGLAVLLFALFRPVAPLLALAAMVFRLVQSAIIGANLMNLQSAWLLISGAQDVAALTPGQTNALAVSFLAIHSHGYDFGLVFFAINCLMTGALIWMSGFVPRLIGVGIGAAGIVYLVGSGLRFFAPEASAAFAPAYGLTVIAEAAFCLWLLIARRPVPRFRAVDLP